MSNDKTQFFIYEDDSLLATLDYDPVAAAKRAEAALEDKDRIISELTDQISTREWENIELQRRVEEARSESGSRKWALDFARVEMMELKRHIRKLGRALRLRR